MAIPNVQIDKQTATADSVDTITATGIPTGSNVLLYLGSEPEGLPTFYEYDVTDTTAMITFSEPGEYLFMVRAPAYTDGGIDYTGKSFYFLLEAT